MVLFIGIQATGKSSFYRERFADTHVRINLDMLRTAGREKILLEACLEGKIPCVIDKMNVKREQRARYIEAARSHEFRVRGFYFPAQLPEVFWRNLQRPVAQQVPKPGILGAYKQLQAPVLEEGFDELWRVTLDGKGGFEVKRWEQ